MPVLRRPDDHRRNVRRRAPCAFFSADPDQDRHLMIAIAVLPGSQRRSLHFRPRVGPDERCPHNVRIPSSSAALMPRPRLLAIEQARRLRSRAEQCASPDPQTPRPLRPRPQNSHRSRPAKPRPFLPAVSSLRGFRTTAPLRAPRACKGPASEALQYSRRPPVAVGPDPKYRGNLGARRGSRRGFCHPGTMVC